MPSPKITTAPAPMAVPVTMQDVETMLPSLGYTPSSLANVRAAVRKCRTAYAEPDLARIPADLDAFERKWGTGRVSFLAVGFKSRDQFCRWRKDVRAVLNRTTIGPAIRTPLFDSWAEILDQVRKNQGRGQLFGRNRDLPLGRLAREASANGRPPDRIDAAWINQTYRRLAGEDRKGFGRGIDAFNDVIAKAASLPGLTKYLPTVSLPKPTPLNEVKSVWTRRAANPATAMLWCEFDAIVESKRFGETGALIEDEPKNFSDNSVLAYQSAIEWMLKWVAANDPLILAGTPGLGDVITHANLVLAANSWILARKAKGLRYDRSSLHGRVTKLVHIALEYLEISGRERSSLVQLRRNKSIRTRSVMRMSADRESWIQEFDANPALQRAVHRLPEILKQQSRAILNRLKSDRPPRPTEVMAALRMGTAAMMAAVLFRASPLRAANMRHLRYRGENPDFRIDWRDRMVRIVVPGEEVKNGAHIDDTSDDDLAPILEFYLNEIRPRLIGSHPFNRHYYDSDYLFPSTSEASVEKTRCVAWYRSGCTAAGVPMTLHQARHISAYCILSVDPNAWSDAAAVLHIDEMTVRKHYAWLSEKRANEAGRAKLRQARKAARKHRKGEFNNVA